MQAQLQTRPDLFHAPKKDDDFEDDDTEEDDNEEPDDSGVEFDEDY